MEQITRFSGLDGMALKVSYDDQPDDVIARVNTLLKEHGMWFEDDGKSHDGYLLYELKFDLSDAEVYCDCLECHYNRDTGE